MVVDPTLTVSAAHEVTVRGEHELLHAVPRLVTALIHTDPAAGPCADPHHLLARHR